MNKALRCLTCLLVLASSQALASPEKVDYCAQGLIQSPINIDQVLQVELPALEFKYRPLGFTIYNDPRVNLFALPNEEVMLEIDTVRYPLANIHLHNPSEHTIAGHGFPLEIHFVHKTIEGNEVVVAQWAIIGSHNATLDRLLDNFERGSHHRMDTGIIVGLDPRDLISPFHGYYKYQGSETFPPCEQNVTWLVLKNTIEVGEQQVERLRHLVGKNSRKVQINNARVIQSSLP